MRIHPPIWDWVSSPFRPKVRKSRAQKNHQKPALMELEARLTPALSVNQPFLGLENNLVIISQELMGRVPQQELANACVLTLDPTQDAISQISRELARRNGLETVRIISHGGEGALFFGSQVVNQEVLATHGDEIAGWGSSLVPGGDLLLYGCSVAGSEEGRNFVTTLAGLTGTDVAASINRTGTGGDTILEFSTGRVDACLQAPIQDWEESKLQLLNENGFIYTSAGGATTITGYTGVGGAVTIPETIAGLPVTSIGSYAFYAETSLTGVSIPNGITSIGDSAFLGCNNLVGISIPDSVTSIGSYAFSNCSKLALVVIPDGIATIGDQTFYNCTSLSSITIPESVTMIGASAFQNCSKLDGIVLPDGLGTIATQTFYNCTSLSSIAIPATITTIGDAAFQNCSKLSTITIPNSVASIGNSAFSFCTTLSTITIPNSVASIGRSAFSFCTTLSTITIPNSVTTIGNLAFHGCTNLSAITVGAANAAFSSVNGILLNKSQTTLIKCPGNKAGAVTIPNSVTTIDGYAFAYCTGLTSVQIPKGIINLGANAFYYCTGLTSVIIPNSITNIGDSAFGNCAILSSVLIGKNITGLQSSAFQGCTSLTEITVDTESPTVNSPSVSPSVRAGLQQIILSFSEPVTGLDLGDLTLTRNETPVSLAGATLQGSGATYRITNLGNITYPVGQYRLQLASPESYISDVVGNTTAGSNLATWKMVGADNALITIRSAKKDGSMEIREASSNRLVKTFTPFPGYPGAVHAVGGNFSGDGRSWVVMAAGEGGAPHLVMMDPGTGNIIRSFFGYSTAFRGGLFIAVGDVNGDGADDLVTGPNAGGGPHIKVYDGKTNQVIFEFMAYAPSFTGGVSVSLADVNGDGRLDIVTGTGKGGGPHVRAFDALNGTDLLSFMAYNPNFRGGVFVIAGDMDGDGLAEIVSGTGVGGGPHVGVFDLRTRTMARGFFAYDPSVLNGVRVGLSDRNGDGILDILTGPGPGMAPLVKIFDGANLNLIDSFFAGAPDDLQGVHVS